MSLGLEEIEYGLLSLKNAADLINADWLGVAMMGDVGTAQECLFHGLARAYRKGLRADPADGSTTSYHDPRGPFVAFIQAAHQLAGKEALSRTALESALALVRNGASGEN